MGDQRCSDSDESKRDIPSFIEPRPPLIVNPLMRPRPQKGTNLLELFDDDSEIDEPEWVQVYLRLKPCNQQNNLYEVKSDRCLITSVDTATAGHGRRTQHHISKMYTFSHIFGPEANQKDIFEHVVKDNLKKLPEGHNFTLLTYGASGSGKTYTLMGTVASPGLVPRSLEYVFRVVDAAQYPIYKPADGGADKLSISEQERELQWVSRLRQVSAPVRDKYRRMSSRLREDLAASNLDLSNRTTHYVWVSFVEIYNEGIYDLLSNSDRSKSSSKLRIREDSNGNVYVKGAMQAFVRSGEEAYDVLATGKHSLQVAATGVHARSSRSHCIFTITMLTHTEGGVRASCVRLCDLAGSERAQRTRNTGARMQESRHINSSLHVLERCLHMLRRKQRQPTDATLVPYRESKLTRLLGAGLSGSRGGAGGAGGEAVAMVVTLNPAPQYAHETRHVLQLAAVARDIQVNHTLADVTESTLESTTAAERSADGGWELVRLRADNERLHFELVQAHSRIAELNTAMEAKRQETASTMFQFVEEAKDMTRQYYEAQMRALRNEMEEMQDEYESKLRAALLPAQGATPRALQSKVAQLMTEIAVLEESLAAERLARARAERELQHLRACIDERDEKANGYNSANNDEMTESDSDNEDDEAGKESLEPTFKREDINRSRLLQRSLIEVKADSLETETIDLDSHRDDTVELDSDSDVSVVNKSRATLKDDDSLNDTSKDSAFLTGENETSDKINETNDCTSNSTYTDEIINMNSITDPIVKDNPLRGTYCVQSLEMSNVSVKDTKATVRGTYFVTDLKMCNSFVSRDKHDTLEESVDDCNAQPEKINVEKETANKASNISAKSNHESDISLAQFEQLEKDAEIVVPHVHTAVFTDIQKLKEKRTYFEDNLQMETEDKVDKINNENKAYFDNIDVGKSEALSEITRKVNLITDRSPSIVKDDVTNDFEPNKIKILLGQSFTKQPDMILSQKKPVLSKKHASVDIFDSPNVIFKNDDKISMPESACLPTEKDMCENITQTENPVNTAPTKEITDEVLTLDAGFEKLKKFIGKMEHNIKTEPAKFALEKPIQAEEITSCGTTKNPISTQEQGKINVTKTCQKPSDEEIGLDRKSYNKKWIDTELSPKQAPAAMFKEPLQVANVDDTQAGEQINKNNNTIDEFENIYEDLTAPRATEFELLVSSQEISSTNINKSNTEPVANDPGKVKYNLRHKTNISADKKEIEKHTEEMVVENQAKIEIKAPKRNLRLRRRKNGKEEETSDQEKESTKLKDIVNLQKEFSDVTLDVPAAHKEAYDIPSPEKLVGEENLPPLQGFQSCPAKSVTRSRRKLFTPRAEPPEEPCGESGDSAERVRVPRPSYHRGRARRKL